MLPFKISLLNSLLRHKHKGILIKNDELNECIKQILNPRVEKDVDISTTNAFLAYMDSSVLSSSMKKLDCIDYDNDDKKFYFHKEDESSILDGCYYIFNEELFDNKVLSISYTNKTSNLTIRYQYNETVGKMARCRIVKLVGDETVSNKVIHYDLDGNVMSTDDWYELAESIMDNLVTKKKNRANREFKFEDALYYGDLETHVLGCAEVLYDQDVEDMEPFYEYENPIYETMGPNCNIIMSTETLTNLIHNMVKSDNQIGSLGFTIIEKDNQFALYNVLDRDKYLMIPITEKKAYELVSKYDDNLTKPGINEIFGRPKEK